MAAIEPEFSFLYIIAPVTMNNFLQQYYEKRVLHVRHPPQYYAHLLSIDDIETFLRLRPPHSSRVIGTNARNPISRQRYSRSDGRIDVEQLLTAYSQGTSFVLRQMQDNLIALRNLCAGGGQLFNCRFQANIYVSPPVAQGSDLHHDTHDVFVIQIQGAKLWTIYTPVVPLPLEDQMLDPSTREEDLTLAGEYLVEEGDLLYIPRGMPHKATTGTTPSIHIALGCLSFTWADLLREAVESAFLREPLLREGLPPGFVTDPHKQNEVINRFQESLAKLSRAIEPTQAIERLSAKFFAGYPTRPSVQEAIQRNSYGEVAIDTLLRAARGLVYRLVENGGTIVLQTPSSSSVFCPLLRHALIFALDSETFKPGEMPGLESVSEKLELARRLIAEGHVIRI